MRPTVQADRQNLLDEICTQLLAPQCALYVEDVLPRLPRCSSEELLDLIDAELCRRTDRGEAPTFEEFAGRFPQLSMETLAQLFEVHLLESGVRSKETPNYSLPGLVQGALITQDDTSEVRRARLESGTRWVAVRIFATQTWTEPQRQHAEHRICAAAAFEHSNLLPFQKPDQWAQNPSTPLEARVVQRDVDGNLFALLPNAEGASLAQLTAAPMEPQKAAKYLLPIVGILELARRADVWMGPVDIEHLQVDHYDRLRILGCGRLDQEDPVVSASPSASDRRAASDPTYEQQQRSIVLRALGNVWARMVGWHVALQQFGSPAASRIDALQRSASEGIALACCESRYASLLDLASDLESMRDFDPRTGRRQRWRWNRTTSRGWWPWG